MSEGSLSPSLSAILPNYNSSEYLAQSLDSLVNQSEAFDEIIIIDDGSTDESLHIIESYQKRYSFIQLIKHITNQGVSESLNDGIQHSQADFIIMCAADDYYALDLVKKIKQTLLAFPQAGLVCGNALVERFDKKKNFLRMLPFPRNCYVDSTTFQTMAENHHVAFNGGGAMFIHRQSMLASGLLHTNLRWHSDWLLYFVIAAQKGFVYLDSVFVYIRLRQAGYSENKHDWRLQKNVILNTIEAYNQYYPTLWSFFKKSALLPYYSMKCLPLFLFDKKARRFLTPKLIWKCLMNNALFFRVGRLLPYRMIWHIRKLLKA